MPTFGRLCAVLVLYGLVYASKSTIRPILNAIAWIFDRLKISTPLGSLSLGGWVARQIRALEHRIDRDLGSAALALEHSANALWHHLAMLTHRLAGSIEGLAIDVLHAALKLEHAVVPRLIRIATRPLHAAVHAIERWARHFVHYVVHALARLERFARHLLHYVLHELRHLLHTLWRYVRHLAGELRHELRAMLKRLRRLESHLGLKWFVGLLHQALRFLRLGWLFAVNVEHAMLWITRQAVRDVYEFVTDGLRELTSFDFCDVLGLVYDLAVLLEPIMREVMGLSDWICRRGGTAMPSASAVTHTYLGGWYPTATTGPLVEERLAPGVPLPQLTRPEL